MKIKIKPSPSGVGLWIMILLIFTLLIISTLLIRGEFFEGEEESKKHIQQLDYLNEIRSSLAHLSMWQLTYTIEDEERERYLSRRRMGKLTERISEIIDTLYSTNTIDELYLSKLKISVDQLIEAHQQVIGEELTVQNPITIDSLQIDYKSVFDIVSFHVNTVQDLNIRNHNMKAKNRYVGMIVLLAIELVFIMFIGLIVYITLYARKRAEKKLVEAEGYFNDVVNSMPTALIGTDKNGKVLRINRSALKLCKNFEWKNRPVEQCFPQLELCIKDLMKSIEISENYENRCVYSEDSEESFIYDISVFPFSVSDRDGAVIILDDVTQQDQMEEELRQTQKMNAIGQLAGGIAHDFNNTLGAILGAAEFIHGGCSEEEKNEFIEMIINSSVKASDLTRKLLTFARKNSRENVNLDLHELINSSTVLLEHSVNKRVQIIKDLKSKEKLISGDSGELQNMILNLVINSNHAMNEGGTITISTGKKYLSSNECKRLPFEVIPGNYIELEISDTGMGIPSEDIKKIFEPFFTTKEHGTGIGLSSVYGTIQNHGGTIKVESTVNVGTTFKIYLPLLKTDGVIENTDKKELIHGEGTILVIDDEEMIRRSLQLILNKLGYKVILADNGRSGIEKYKENSKKINLIILDMIMPVMDGREALEKIRKIDKSVPVIICSGYAESEDIYKAKEISIQGVIPKPFSGTKLSRIVSENIKKIEN